MKKLFGIPIIEDDRFDADEGFLLSVKRTCKCDPATLIKLTSSPQLGIQCGCGAVWPVLLESEVE